MADQIIAATLQVDASSADTASKSIKDMKENVKQLRTEFENTKDGSAEQAAAFQKLKTAQDTLATSSKNLNKTVSESPTHFKNIKEGMSALPGPLGAASEGANKLNSTFIKLVANPIVLTITALVAVFAFLYKAFTNTFEGGEKVEQVFAGIKAAVQVVIDRILDLGGAIIKFFSGDFKGALADAKKAVTGIGDEIADTYSRVSQLTKQIQELHKEQNKNDLEQAERAKQLAILREQANDESVPIAKRKAALLELKADSEQNAKDDIDLAKRTAEAKIALLSFGKDGAKKNQDEINKIRIDQINVETENANELRRIEKQVTAVEKQELQERKEAQQKANEEAKKRRDELVEYTNKLAKIQQENELLTITDTYEKEKKLLENKIADDRRSNELSLQNKKITQQQFNTLQNSLDEQANLQRAQLTEKHNKEISDKEIAFQIDLSKIRQKIQLDGIRDQRQAEKFQLEITYEQNLNDAIKRYKGDAEKLNQIKLALAEQFKADQDKQQAKFDLEDAKKKFLADEAKAKAVIDNKKIAYDERIKAVDEEQAIVQQAFDNKLISEADFTSKSAALAQARIQIREEEKKHTELVTSAIGDAFGSLAEIAGKQTAVGKALSIAQTTIKTFQSAISAFSGMVETIPGPVGIALGVVAAAGAIATGIAAVKKIVAVQVPGQGTSGSVPTGIQTPQAPIAPTQTSTKIDANSVNNIGNAAAGGVNARAYVVSADIENDAERNARLNRAARLGN